MFKPLVKGLRLDSWTKMAVSAAILVYFSVIALTVLLPNLDFRIILLIVGLVYLGMPHGAMDIFLVSRSVKSLKDLLIFLASYIILATSILFLWILAPTFSFLIFILYSMFHFADSDLQKGILDNPMTILEFLARFPLPFCVPLIFYEIETLELISYIHKDVSIVNYLMPIKFLGYLGLFLTAVFVILKTIDLIRDFQNQDLAFLEPLVLCVLFSQISPLYALGIYFCFIHAIKHIINVLQKVEIKSYKSILPYWILPLIGLPIMFWIYSKSEIYSIEKFQVHIFQYILITLSALALPHALLVRYCKYKKIIS